MRSFTCPSHYHHHHPHLSHLSPTLRQNWKPRAKWHSTLTDTRTTNRFSYLAATAATSTQSSGGWGDQDSSPGVTPAPLKEEQGDTMPGSFEPVHREPSLPWTGVVGMNF